jgi:hypothetical protein
MHLISLALAVVAFRAMLGAVELGEAGMGVAHGAFLAISLLLIVCLLYAMLRGNRPS